MVKSKRGKKWKKIAVTSRRCNFFLQFLTIKVIIEFSGTWFNRENISESTLSFSVALSNYTFQYQWDIKDIWKKNVSCNLLPHYFLSLRSYFFSFWLLYACIRTAFWARPSIILIPENRNKHLSGLPFRVVWTPICLQITFGSSQALYLLSDALLAAFVQVLMQHG